MAAPPALVKVPVSPMWEFLGLELKAIPPQEFRQRFQTEYRGGLTVTAVRPQGPLPSKACAAATCWWECTSGRRSPWRTCSTS